jgi:hypothetical protein
MRALTAIAILASGLLLAASPSVDAGPRCGRVKPSCHAGQMYRAWRVAPPWRAWRYDPNDPTGEFRGFPSWARKAFSDPRH